jgi:hypothetical protein
VTHQSLTRSLPIRPMNPIPKHMPAPISPRTSEPCKAATRGLLKLERRAINPSSDTIPPTIRLRFSMLFRLYGDPVKISTSHNLRFRP